MRWAIVGTMDEAPEIVAAWAAWHLAQGAAELHIYLDRANARTQALLAKLPKVFVTVCDVDFYRRTFDFKRPINHQRRQTKNATHAYQKCDVDYLIHMDADEYLIQHTSLSDELAALRHGVFLSIPNVERVFTSLDKPGAIFTRHFRVSTRDDPQLEAPSTDAEGITRSGFAGHTEGKSASPKGIDLILGIHRPRYATNAMGRKRPPKRVSSSSVIAHFEGLTPTDWIQKRLRKARFLERSKTHPVGNHMQVQVDAVLAAERSKAGLFAVHDRLKRINTLPQDGSVLELDVDVAKAVAAAFPDENLEMTVQMFDAWLKSEKAEFFEEFECLM